MQAKSSIYTYSFKVKECGKGNEEGEGEVLLLPKDINQNSSEEDDCPSPVLSRRHSRTNPTCAAGPAATCEDDGAKAGHGVAAEADLDMPPASADASAFAPHAQETACSDARKACDKQGRQTPKDSKTGDDGCSATRMVSAERAKREREKERILRAEVDRLTSALDAGAGAAAKGPPPSSGSGPTVGNGIASFFTKRRKVGEEDPERQGTNGIQEGGAHSENRVPEEAATSENAKKLEIERAKEELQGEKEALEKKRKEVEERGKAVEEKGKEVEDKLKRAEENAARPARVLGELECCICAGIMAMSHSLRCGHTFCGLCIARWLKQGKRTCPQCRVSIPAHDKPNRVHACDKIIEGMRPSLTAEQIQDLDERIEEFKKRLHEREDAQQGAGSGSARGRGRGGRGRGGRGGGAGAQRPAANTFFHSPLEHFIHQLVESDSDSESGSESESDESDHDDSDGEDASSASSDEVVIVSPVPAWPGRARGGARARGRARGGGGRRGVRGR